MSIDISRMYTENMGAVRAALLVYEKNYDVIDELAGDVFVKALESAESFKADSCPATWLVGIAKNVGRMHVRAAQRSVDLVSEAEFVGGEVESYADTLEASDPSDDPSLLEDADSLLEQALSQMPENMQQAVVMRYKGYSNEEIAEKLEVSASRVSAYISESRSYFN